MSNFTKYKKWDNGCYVLSKEQVHIPDVKLTNDGIVEDMRLKSTMNDDGNSYYDAICITIDGKSWLVKEDPRVKPSIRK
tara:strand:+ start:1302 stop:1538 length:237 start_codon:yes stop_codon:yes gene_type:complete